MGSPGSWDEEKSPRNSPAVHVWLNFGDRSYILGAEVLLACSSQGCVVISDVCRGFWLPFPKCLVHAQVASSSRNDQGDPVCCKACFKTGWRKSRKKKEGRISSVLTPHHANFCAGRKRKHELFDLQLRAWKARGKQAPWPAQKVGFLPASSSLIASSSSLRHCRACSVKILEARPGV